MIINVHFQVRPWVIAGIFFVPVIPIKFKCLPRRVDSSQWCGFSSSLPFSLVVI